MKKEQLIKETKEKLEEINIRTQVMRDKISQNNEADFHKKAQSLIDKLEEIRSWLEHELNKFRQSESDKESEVTEFEKNIFTGIESFEDAFTKAGLLFTANE